jgi:integrative and conjugative element protein (TIGR02256 family)
VTDAGPALARRQLADLVEVSGGAVELLEETQTKVGPVFLISIDTSGLTQGPDGIQVRDRERFQIVVPDEFPFEPPSVWTQHRRWAGTPHVQWGRHPCLYLAPAVEWDPSDGMRGLITRLAQWVERAVAGTLDPDGQPLHPPAVYSKVSAGRVLVHSDLGDRVPWADDGAGTEWKTLFAWCAVRGQRVDVLEWVDLETAVDRAFDDEALVFDGARPYIVIPATLVSGQFGSEYPTTVDALSDALSQHGYLRGQLLWDLATSTLINRRLRKRQRAEDNSAAGERWDADEYREGKIKDETGDPDDIDTPGGSDDSHDRDDEAPLFTALIVGTPARRRADGPRLGHLAAWRLDSISSRVADLFGSVRSMTQTDLPERVREFALEWFASAKVQWMDVMENRPEVTDRRDAGTPVNWLAGRRVLLLGCGAIGGPVAELCVRAGASALTVADGGVVHPGILVRQPFDDTDIGMPKACALAARLSNIRPELDVESVVGDVRTTFFTANLTSADPTARDPTDYDLIIDATANASVRAVIEKARRNLDQCPPLVTMIIGHDATRGLVTVNLSESTGAATDSFRKVALLASSRDASWKDIGEDLFPRQPRTELFFPEPGCSAPTFVGSVAQTTALAGLMLNEAFVVLADVTADGGAAGSSPVIFASAVRLGLASDTLGISRAEWLPDLVERDHSSGFEVRVTSAALAEVRTEVRRGHRVRGPRIETGGMLLGAIDEATGVIYVDRVSGPPPDSYLSESYFQHGLEGAQARIDEETERTGKITGFIGFWHTHPGGRAYPSDTDWQGMASIVGPDGTRRRALMLIFAAPMKRWSSWRHGDSDRLSDPDVFMRVVPRSAKPIAAEHPGYVGGLDLQVLPLGSYFRGGFSGGRREPWLGVAGASSGHVQKAASKPDQQNPRRPRRRRFGPRR